MQRLRKHFLKHFLSFLPDKRSLLLAISRKRTTLLCTSFIFGFMTSGFRRIIIWGLPAFLMAFISIPSLKIIQLTDNNFDDKHPVISGDNIIWQQADGKIISYDMLRDYSKEIGQLKGTSLLSIDGGTLCWYQKESQGDFIYFSSTDNSGLYRLNAGGEITLNPQIKNRKLAWCVRTDADYILCLFNLNSHKTTRIHLAQTIKPLFCLGSRFLAFSAIENSRQAVRTLDVRTGKLKTISNPDFENGRPFCHGMRVAWQAFDGHDDEIFCYDDYTGYTYRITENEIDDYAPRLSDHSLCWLRAKEDDSGIELMDFSSMETTTLMASLASNRHPAMDNDYVVWVNGSGNTCRLSMYDIQAQSYQQIGQYNFSHAKPYLSNHTIVWQGSDGNDDEIFICRLDSLSN